MGAASVQIKEIDLSTRVASFEGVFGAIVIPAKKGDISRPFFVSSDTQFLNATTPDGSVGVGFDLSYFSALAYLERANKLYVQRVINGAFYAGLTVDSTGTAATQAVFDGAIASVTGNVQLSADVAGLSGNLILLTGDGVKTLAVLVSDWNTANAANTVTLDSANGADIPDAAQAMQLAGATDGSANLPLPVDTDMADPSAYAFTGEQAILIHSANEGTWGNDVGIKITTVADDPDLLEPDSFLIEVFKTANQVAPLESFLVSRVLGQKDGRGLNMYIEDVLEGSSYIRAISNPAVDETVLPQTQATFLALSDGDDGLAISATNMIAGANKFLNKAETSVTLLLDGGYAVPAFQIALDVVAQTRQDCVAILSVPFAAEDSSSYMTEIVDYRKTDLNLNSSYSALYSPHLKIQDRFNDREIYVAPDGYVSGSISFSAQNFEIWFPPAGKRRGVLSVLDAKRRYEDGELDVLANAGVNPIRFIDGEGIIVWGQKTLQARASALDRLNVRLLLIVIEPAIKTLLEEFLFELNDTGTRSIIETKLEAYLEGIKARRGVTDFDVVADDSNNTQDDIDANRLNVDIFIKPSRSIEDIPVRVVITPSNISFADAAGSI